MRNFLVKLLLAPPLFLLLISSLQALRTFIQYTVNERLHEEKAIVFFSVGFLASLLALFVLNKNALLNQAYVFGHELTHALFAKLSGGKVRKISISKSSGYALIDAKGDNFISRLSPYFFPFYPVLFLLVLTILRLGGTNFTKNSALSHGLICTHGALWAFHYYFTIKVLYIGQDDVRDSGGLLALVAIFILNIYLLVGIFSLHSNVSAFTYYFSELEGYCVYNSFIVVEFLREFLRKLLASSFQSAFE